MSEKYSLHQYNRTGDIGVRSTIIILWVPFIINKIHPCNIQISMLKGKAFAVVSCFCIDVGYMSLLVLHLYLCGPILANKPLEKHSL